MYLLKRSGIFNPTRRLFAADILTPAEFDAIAGELGFKPICARKISYVAARQAQTATPVTTDWKGEMTYNVAEAGDWIVTNLSVKRLPLTDEAGRLNRYVIKAATFSKLYQGDTGETEQGSIFKAIGVVDAISMPAGFDILAPWNTRQTMTDGYLLRNDTQIYGIDRQTFADTYEPVTS